MAKTPVPELNFEGVCPDCGRRTVELPQPLPVVGDDFDWRVRDYDGFRLFMLEELAARFPERTRWTPADLEVVLVEQLAALLDRFSDMLDRVSGEGFLETARRPDSVRRLLATIGYDAVRMAQARGDIDSAETDPVRLHELLERFWFHDPRAMELARREGPGAIFTQRRMVTIDDYAERLQDHPLVKRATAWQEWSGSWFTVRAAVVNWENRGLDEEGIAFPDEVKVRVAAFHTERALALPDWGGAPTIRSVLQVYLDAYRMAGQEVILADAAGVGISLSLSIRLQDEYYQSEVRHGIDAALGTGAGGFFEPGRLRFGEDLHAGDLIQTVMALEGVAHVCVNRFKRIGSQYQDQAVSGRIELKGIEIALCANRPDHPEQGYYRLVLHGGRLG